MRDRQDDMNKAILAIRDLRGQLQALEKRLGSNEPANPWTSAADLRQKVSAIEDQLIQVTPKPVSDELNYPNKTQQQTLATWQNAVDSTDAPPTEGELGVYAELDLQLESQLRNAPKFFPRILLSTR